MVFLKQILSYLYLKYIKRYKCSFSISSKISKESIFEEMTKVSSNTFFHGKLSFGSYISSYCRISADIGRFTSIGESVTTTTGKHPIHEPFVSTSPCFYSLNTNKLQCGSTFATKQLFQEYSYCDTQNKIAVKIGNDCWIGNGAFLVGGITISDGAVVLAHAVVTKDVPPYAIVAGVPARVVGYRFDEETISWLLKVRWWDNDLSWFKKKWELLTSLEKLKKYYEGKL